MAKDNRFEKIYKQSAGSMEIWVDKETGVTPNTPEDKET